MTTTTRGILGSQADRGNGARGAALGSLLAMRECGALRGRGGVVPQNLLVQLLDDILLHKVVRTAFTLISRNNALGKIFQD